MASRKRRNVRKFLRYAICMVSMFALTLGLMRSPNVYADQASGSSTQTTDATTKDSSETGVEYAIIADTADEIYGHKLIAESDTLEMYFYEPTLSILLRDKETGAIIESTLREDDPNSNKKWNGYMESGFVISVISGVNDTGQADLVNDAPTMEVNLLSNGFHAKVFYDEYRFGYEVTVTLEGSDVVVTIPDEGIVEDAATGNYISTISMYPFMGYTYLGDRDGYMFVPDGSGSIIYLDDKEGRFSGGFAQPVYGDNAGIKDSAVISLFWDEFQTVNDSESILAPVFGMVHTDSEFGYLGIIEEGAYNAQIEAYPNGAVLDYNRIYTKFVLRKLIVQPTSSNSGGSITQAESDRSHENLTVRYCFVDKDQADYCGLAVTYRNYLLDNGGLIKKDDTYKTRIDFLGTEREEWLIFTKKVTMTTTENIREMYDELTDAGVTDILSLYKGWQKGGLYDLPVTKFKADSAIGGNSGITSLLDDLNGTGIDLYLYQDMLRINPDTNNTTFNVVKRINKRIFEELTYKEVYNTFLYLIPSRTMQLGEKLCKSFGKNGISNIAVAGISNTLFSFSYSGNYYSREYTADMYDALISEIDDSYNLTLEQPYAYLWNHTDSYVDMPVGTSNYVFEGEEVPFLSIVLKGIMPMYSEYVNFEANKEEFFLKLVESGVYPSFYITYEDSAKLIYTNSADLYSSKYSVYKDDIISYDNELKQVYEQVKDSCIIDHERLDSGVTVVTYDNGKKIYINYSDEAAVVDGITVEAMSYKVGDAR